MFMYYGCYCPPSLSLTGDPVHHTLSPKAQGCGCCDLYTNEPMWKDVTTNTANDDEILFYESSE